MTVIAAAPPCGHSSQISIELADLRRDRAAIEAVWNSGLCCDRYRYQFYLNNPAGDGRIWRLNDGGGGLVGALGLHPRRFSVEGRACTIGAIGNQAVEPAFRSAGPAVKMQRALLGSLAAAGYPFAIGATSKAGPVLKRAGCQVVGDVQRWVKPLRTGQKLAGTLKHRWLGCVAGGLLDTALRLTARETYAPRPGNFTCGFTNGFDARFDDLWQRAACQFGITGERTSSYLNWRYLKNTDEPRQIFCAESKQEGLLGYLVAMQADGALQISDLFFDRPEVLDVLLAEFLRHIRRNHQVEVVAMELFGSHRVAQALRRFGFHRRPHARQVYISASASSIPRAVLLDEERWFLTGADVSL